MRSTRRRYHQESEVKKIRRYRLLMLLLLVAATSGCQCLKSTKFHPPNVVRPAPACSNSGSALVNAELAYQRATLRERHCDASCVDYFFQAAANSWQDIEQQLLQTGYAEGRAAKLYRSSLIKLIESGQRFRRLDPSQGIQVFTESGPLLVPTTYCGFPWQPADFDRLKVVGEYTSEELNSVYRCRGVGVATLAFHCRRPHESFRSNEQIFPATALLRQASNGQFQLQLFDPLRISSVYVGGQQIDLERDNSAPIAFRQSQDERDYIEGFLQPGASDQNTGLFMIEPYQPGKIPVVFVHGLLSDPYTWANIANEMRADPELLARYQICGFKYATGEPFLSSAATLRRQLRQFQTQLDPHGSDPALSQIVLVGHSMGGLISKLQVTYSGTQLWDSVSKCRFDQIVTSAEARAGLAEAFFFEPSPSVARVVYIGTPHYGSPWAKRPIGRIGAKLVEEPEDIQDFHNRLIRDNAGVFSREFTRRVPTSIDLLRPDSQLLAGIKKLPTDQRVRFHSIFGSGYHMLYAGDSDSVVPVKSARIANNTTEKSIHAKHTKLHNDPEGISELLCILRRHLHEFQAPIPQYEAMPTFVMPRPE